MDAPPFWGLGSVPFAALLLAIALLPLIPATQHWWHRNLHRLYVSLGCAAAMLAYYTVARGPRAVPHVLEHAVLAEYVPFMAVLFSLYVISGGIALTGDLRARPATNTAFLAVGALIASFVGTTGASMLLIRPVLQTNAERRHVTHTVVFFIFLVSNAGGCLLPIGDPPLFLGYLYGVPFLWTMRLWDGWLLCCTVLLALYYVIDRRAYARETPADIVRDIVERRPLRLQGWVNVLLLGAVVACVATTGPVLRELALLGLAGLSLWWTPAGVRAHNRFNYTAILEVAALFIGIFITMQVPVEFLKARGAALGLTEPWQFFWATGLLSSFLDNAPTYVVFFETAKAIPPEAGATLVAVHGGFIDERLLIAVSLGAVFMGANSYIGNGPNFMVKSIAEEAGVRMPSFFGYILRWVLPVLIPVFIGITFLMLMDWSPG
jgi:Na+/H+ antiporter NhaD/arsenite permease-like protein